MRAELHPLDQPDHVVAVASWDGSNGTLEESEGAPEGIGRLLRPTPVVVEDPSLRRQGTHGETLLAPGSLEWFRAALLTRAEALGLGVRFVPEVREGGWDPAAQYSTFEERIERLASSEA